MSNAEQHYRSGLALFGQGRVSDALTAFESAARLAPGAAPVHHMLGLALQRAGRLDEADAAISRAIRLQRKPDYLANRALVRCGLERFDDAAADAEAALRLAPDHIGALCNLGLAHMGAKRFAVAASAFTRAVGIAPDFAPARENLERAIGGIEDDVEILSAASAYLAVAPDSPRAHKIMGSARRALGDSRGTVAALRSAVELTPDDLQAYSALIFHLNYLDDATAPEQMSVVSAFHHALAEKATPFVHTPVMTAAHRALRIGFVSGDLREHSVSQFLLAILPQLQARGLRLAAYQTSPKTDAVTAQLKPMFETWREIADTTDESAAAQIKADEIDILIDLAGHTKGARPRLFAMRPAPLAVTWLGYSGTTGNPGIDYILCNDWVLPPDQERYFTERPLRLSGPFLCFSPPQVEAPAPEWTGRVAFGSFNTLNKLSDRTIAIWSRVLAAVPDSDLILKAKAFRTREARAATTERFAARGIDAARLVMIDRTPSRQEHLALYGRLALALDPWPYAGTTTTMEALYMGVPVLTLNEGAFISRVSASILSAAGLEAWIAVDEDDYVRKAVTAAADAARLAAIRPDIRARVVGSALCDPVAFGAAFSQAMRDIWRQWCNDGTGNPQATNPSRSRADA